MICGLIAGITNERSDFSPPQGPVEQLMSGSVSPLGASCSDGYVHKKRAALAHTGARSEHIRQQLIGEPVRTEIVDQLCLCTCVLMY